MRPLSAGHAHSGHSPCLALGPIDQNGAHQKIKQTSRRKYYCAFQIVGLRSISRVFEDRHEENHDDDKRQNDPDGQRGSGLQYDQTLAQLVAREIYDAQHQNYQRCDYHYPKEQEHRYLTKDVA